MTSQALLFTTVDTLLFLEQWIDVSDKSGNEANMFGAAPPRLATRRTEQIGHHRSGRCFESSLRKDTALRSVPNVERRPRVLSQHLLQPELISSIQGALSVKASSHELGNVAIFSNRHADHRPLRHRGIVLVALKGARIRSEER